jgi:hypothetical protein
VSIVKKLSGGSKSFKADSLFFGTSFKMGVSIQPLSMYRKLEAGYKKANMSAGRIMRTMMMRRIPKGGKKKKKSLPGFPPRSHTSGNEFGIKTIVYKYDENTRTLKVGPLNRSPSKDMPGLLDLGGRTMITVRRGFGKNPPRESRVVRIAPRPYANVVLNDFKNDYPELYRNII